MEQNKAGDPMQGTSPTRRPAWFQDRWFRVGFVVWLSTVTLALLPVLPPDARVNFANHWADFALLPITLGLAAWNVWESDSPSEAKFWGFVVAALTAWFLVRIIYVVRPEDAGFITDVVADLLYGVFYLNLALALEMKPHTRPWDRSSIHSKDEGIPVFTTLAFFAAAVVFFIIIPASEEPYSNHFWSYSFGLYVVMDLYLCGRLLSLSHRGRDHWANVYRWLMVTFVLWAITDAAEGALYAAPVPWATPGSLFDFLWYVPSLTLIIALRSRWWPPPVAVAD